MVKVSLRAEGLTSGYERGINIVENVTITAEERKITTIIGPNGAGKSTLLKALCGILIPTSGEVFFSDKKITHLSTRDTRLLGITYIPQQDVVFPRLTVEENLLIGGKIIGMLNRSIHSKLDEIIDGFPNIRSKLGDQAGDLSGGEQKMLALARGLIIDARIFLIDEPTAALSPNLTREMFEKILKLKKDGRTVLMVEQDVKGALNISDHTYAMVMGRITYEATADRALKELENVVQSWLSSTPQPLGSSDFSS